MERRKFLIGAAGTAVGASALVGSGAFSAARIENRDVDIAVSGDPDALIGLEPGDDTHLVGLDDGELYIDFNADEGGDGVNPNSTYQVGAIGEEGADSIDNYVNGEGADPDVSSNDVLYEVDDEDVEMNNTAFTLTNQSDADYDIELFYEGETVDGSTVVAVGQSPPDAVGGSYGAAAFELDPDETDEGGRLGGFPLGSGAAFHISLLVVTEDVDYDDLDDQWAGELIVQAGEQEGDYS